MPPPWYDQGLEHIWLPYTPMRGPTPLAVTSTQGSRITLADGRQLIDGIASWWTACHGYNHPKLIAAVKAQADLMPHVMLGGLVHEGAMKLASRLSTLTGMPRVFFSDSGSVAVEVALKMALQFWQISGKPRKNRFICFRHGYHGDTLGAMSVSDPDQSIHQAFKATAQAAAGAQIVLDLPSNLHDFDALLAGLSHEVAAIILEPLLQGAGGMKFHSPETLAAIAAAANRHSILFIADEIATGFGRTGTLFACQQAAIRPDILCLGKALTGGMMTLAATLATDHVFHAFLDTPFMHGPTYMANPLACAAANASLDLFQNEPRLQQVKTIQTLLHQGLQPCHGLPGVLDVRVQGAVGVVQLAKCDRVALRKEFISRGCWIRPLEDVIYLTPAFTIPPPDLQHLTREIVNVVQGL